MYYVHNVYVASIQVELHTGHTTKSKQIKAYAHRVLYVSTFII